ncbi:hypothetical protein [Caulobacter sp. 602-1]|uniref:hypothetical protein n=1 Tax=Caulobacter sp. 602-1 TaxID=2492472 RepID=UPI00131570BA|nr:hypothetical protein [Caulobacter sp. 602-1]
MAGAERPRAPAPAPALPEVRGATGEHGRCAFEVDELAGLLRQAWRIVVPR